MKYFIYFSVSGNGDFLADRFKEKGFQPVKVELIKPIKKVGFFTILKFGFRAGLQKKEKIKEINIDLKEGDEVIIGSPIWNDRLSTPINAVLSQLALNKETTSFIVYPAGETAKKVVDQLKKLGFSKEPIVYPHPLKSPEQFEVALKQLCK